MNQNPILLSQSERVGVCFGMVNIKGLGVFTRDGNFIIYLCLCKVDKKQLNNFRGKYYFVEIGYLLKFTLCPLFEKHLV